MDARDRPLDLEELQALGGVWRCTLDLEDETSPRSLTCQLQVRELEFGGMRTQLFTTDEDLSRSTPLMRWEASARGGARVALRLELGQWLLEGSGERTAAGLRCGPVRGRVLRGTDEDYAGSFELLPSLPAVDDAALPALAARWQQRLDARPAPPVRFARDGFCGLWRLLLALDGATPAVLTLRLGTRTFASDGSAVPIAGSWGVYDQGIRSDSGRSWKRDTAPKLAGTHLWLRVERDRSAATLRGIGDLPARESFTLWGRPALDSIAAELGARAAQGGGAAGGAAPGGAAQAPGARGAVVAPGVVADRVEGWAYFGAASDLEHSVAGRFSLSRCADAEEER